MTELPILAKEPEITATYAANQVMILVGETGSGKTTKMPVYAHNHNVATGLTRKVGVTQPRKIAATSTSSFVAKQLGTIVGDLVGYQIRFDDRTADHTRIKFMTDGILLEEIQHDPELSEYDTIIVDEAHERSENIDFLLGLLKNLLKRRPDLKLVVTSATIDQQKFSRYFNNAPVVNVSGRMYPVEIIWSETDIPEWMMVEEVSQRVITINKTKPKGDILVFMTGADDINKVITRLEKAAMWNVVILPAYGDLSFEDQQKIFRSYPGKRKVVVATNIAETSITPPGVVYVVDSGLIKQANFHTDTGIQSLDVVEHSQAGCDQRAGRAGRLESGVCYRMYTQENFRARLLFTKPEILRVSLAKTVLKMESIGIADIEGFDFLDAPNPEAFHEAYETLIALGAIRHGVRGLTEIGRGMAKLPLDPRISRMVLEAEKHGCVKNVVTVAAFLSVRNIFVRPKESEWQADEAHRSFKDSKSDALTFLKVWAQYEHSGFNNRWCSTNFINAKLMVEVKKIREQLFQVLSGHGMKLTECASDTATAKAVAMGQVYNLFEHAFRGAYRGVQRANVGAIHIHPSSGLFRGFHNPRFIVVTDIVQTSKVWGRGCSVVEPEWLPELVPHLCSTTNPVVEDWTPGDAMATIRQDLTFNGNPLSSTRKKVSVGEARRIQEQTIREAEAKGYVKLTFTQRLGEGIFPDWFGYSGGQEYKAWNSSHVMPGISYLCKVEDFLGRKYAAPEIQLFNFPQPATTKVSAKPQSNQEPRRETMAVAGHPTDYRRDYISSVVMDPESEVEDAVGDPQDTNQFTEIAPRWFKCSCGTTERVTKSEWAEYQSGREIKIVCSSCETGGSVRKS